MKAFDIDPERAGLHKNLFGKRYKRYFSLFGGRATEEQEHSRQAKDEQLLAFYMAAEKGATGYLIDKFKRVYLKEARRRKKKLFKQFFSLYPAHLPKEVSGKLNRIYKDELEQPNLGTVPKVPPSSTNLSTKNRK